MILIPGLSSGGGTWDATVDHFKDRYECHVLTVAGFAGVPRVPAPMLDRVVDDLAEYIRTHHLERPIFLFESEGNYTRMHFRAESPLVRRSLNALEQRLDPNTFFRANRAEIFNLRWIESVDEAVSGGLAVTLRGGRTVDMSRRRSDKLREILSL